MAQVTNEESAAWTWSSVLAGVLAALIVQVLLTMLGFGVGLLSVSPSAGRGIAWGAFAWWALSGIIAAFIGGWVAGAFAPTTDRRLRVAGALTAWALATLIVVATSGLAVGTGTVAATLAGPTADISARISRLAYDPDRPTATGQAAAGANRAALEDAQKHFAAAMLASFIALVLGAATAGVAGMMAPVMPGREGQPERRNVLE